MSFKVVVTDYWYPNLNPELKVFKNYDIELVDCKGTIKTEDQLIDVTKDADAVIVQFCKMTKRVIDNLVRCKLIIRYAIGVDVIDVEAATEKKIMIANVPDYCIDEVSNHAIALILSLTRKVNYMDRQVRSGNVKFELAIPIKRNLLNTLGIVGYGRIGEAVAKKLKGFNFKRIIYFDPYKNNNKYAEKVDFDTLLAESDIITLHAPATDKTYNMFNREVFKKMKYGAYIVNTSRGALIDEEALEWALSQKLLAGAGLDVFHSEGFEGKQRFFPFKNVVLTPHIAWYSEQSFEELQRKVAEQVVESLYKGKPRNWINPF
mgnify:FL=1